MKGGASFPTAARTPPSLLLLSRERLLRRPSLEPALFRVLRFPVLKDVPSVSYHARMLSARRMIAAVCP